MIDIVLIVIVVMFGTLFYDKHRRNKFIIKEGFSLPYKLTNDKSYNSDSLYQQDTQLASNYTVDFGAGNITMADSQIFTPSYAGFLNNYSSTSQQKGNFSPYTLNANMENYQHIDYDNNIASIYGYKSAGYDTTPQSTVLTCTANDGLMGMNRWCGCETTNSINGGTGTTETATKRLTGGVNPKTLLPPRIVPPITDMEAWGTDNYTIHSAINNYRSNDLFLSGYVTLEDCKCHGVCNCTRKWNKPFVKESFNNINVKNSNDHNYLTPYDVSEQRLSRPQILQNYGISTVPEKSEYISITNGDDLMFIEKQRKCGFKFPSPDYITGDEPSMVYDPRMVGYSDSKRSYVDKLLGQPKFYYDDINTARAPNYITRNKIDIYSFGESTGRLKNPKDKLSCGDNNQLAVEEFHNSALQHRSDIMQSLMNKRNGEMWQLREFPINTNGQRMLGGTSKI